MENIGVRIPEKLKKDFKVKCCKEGLNMSDVILHKIKEFIEESEGETK
jgi:antitoxin component of RelBE/YafQ-DinJ toxin-antitoxin module